MDGEAHEPRPVGRASLIGACVFVLLLVVGMEVRKDGGAGRPTGSSSAPISPQSPEARLATLEPAASPRARASAVRRLSSLLDILEAECPANSRRELAALAVRGRQELRARGIASMPTDVLNGVMAQEDIGRTASCGPYFERSVASLLTADR